MDGFSSNTQISNFTNILPRGADLFHADGRNDRRTDMKQLITAFRNFVVAPNLT